MTVYYWHNQGRIGNLVFQYAAIMNLIGPADRVLCFDNEIFSFIDADSRFVRLPSPRWFGQKFNIVANRISDFLAGIGVVSEAYPEPVLVKHNYVSEGRVVKFRRGVFPFFVRVKGFFQHDKWISSQLRFKPEKLAAAKENLASVPASDVKVAVHLRLSDYKDWVVLGEKDVSIDAAWYREAIKYIEKNIKDPSFVFFTDDKDEAAKLDICNGAKFYSGADAAEELIAMSLCDHAIISPSTFAYCAVMANYYDGKIIVAPEFWAGFKSREWYPASIKTDSMIYL